METGSYIAGLEAIGSGQIHEGILERKAVKGNRAPTMTEYIRYFPGRAVVLEILV